MTSIERLQIKLPKPFYTFEIKEVNTLSELIECNDSGIRVNMNIGEPDDHHVYDKNLSINLVIYHQPHYAIEDCRYIVSEIQHSLSYKILPWWTCNF